MIFSNAFRWLRAKPNLRVAIAVTAMLWCFFVASMSQARAAEPWRAVDIATSQSNQTRMLWRTPENAFQIWNVDDAGTKTRVSPLFGPIQEGGQAWTAREVAVAGEGATRLLLSRADGAAAVWTLGSDLNFASSSPAYGPFGGWTPADLAVAGDGTVRLLWRNANSSCAVWSISSSGEVLSSPAFGPYQDGNFFWTAHHIAVGGDSRVRVLWKRGNGAGAVWTLGADLNFGSSSRGFGPFDGWEAGALALGTSGDSKRHMLWLNSDGRAAFWKLRSEDALPVPEALEVNATYGPFDGWRARTISVGGDGQMRALWNHSDGRAAFWKLSPDGLNVLVNVIFGPLPEAPPPPEPPSSGPSSTRISYENGNEIFTVNIDGTNLINVSQNAAEDKDAVVSPDGRKILFDSNRDVPIDEYGYRAGPVSLYVANADGSDLRRLTFNGSPGSFHARWSPDSSKIAFSLNGDITVINADGSGLSNLTGATQSAFDHDPRWSPDGSKISFTSQRGSQTRIYSISADGTDLRNLSQNAVETYDYSALWSPDGSRLVFRRETIQPTPPPGSPPNYSRTIEIYTMNADGSTQTNVSHNGSDNIYPSWNPSGTKIVFASSETGLSAIIVSNPDGSGQLRVSAGQGTQPQWSRDGQRILFLTFRDGSTNTEIYSVNANGSGLANLTRHPMFDFSIRQSPNGSRIAFESGRAGELRNGDTYGTSQIYVMNPDGSSITRVTQTTDFVFRAQWVASAATARAAEAKPTAPASNSAPSASGS